MVLKIYGVPGSQPVRAVMWVLQMKKLEYEFVKAVPGTPADKKYSSQHPAYQKLSKGRGQIPMMDDDGLIIGESHAILTYLCQKHGWTDLYPADLRARAKVDEMLHHHHGSGARVLAPLFAVGIRPDLGITKSYMTRTEKNIKKCFDFFEQILAEQSYLAADHMTLADIAAYEEVVPLLPEHVGNLDLAPYPRTQDWVKRMKAAPEHDAFHSGHKLPMIFQWAKQKVHAAMAKL